MKTRTTTVIVKRPDGTFVEKTVTVEVVTRWPEGDKRRHRIIDERCHGSYVPCKRGEHDRTYFDSATFIPTYLKRIG